MHYIQKIERLSQTGVVKNTSTTNHFFPRTVLEVSTAQHWWNCFRSFRACFLDGWKLLSLQSWFLHVAEVWVEAMESFFSTLWDCSICGFTGNDLWGLSSKLGSLGLLNSLDKTVSGSFMGSAADTLSEDVIMISSNFDPSWASSRTFTMYWLAELVCSGMLFPESNNCSSSDPKCKDAFNVFNAERLISKGAVPWMMAALIDPSRPPRMIGIVMDSVDISCWPLPKRKWLVSAKGLGIFMLRSLHICWNSDNVWLPIMVRPHPESKTPYPGDDTNSCSDVFRSCCWWTCRRMRSIKETGVCCPKTVLVVNTTHWM